MAHETNVVGRPSAPQAFRSTRVVTPDGVRPATIVTDSGRIEKVVAWEQIPSGAVLHDFGDYILMPGLVDTHVHINEAGPGPGRTDWEGFATATMAAAAGGVTTLVDMPLNCVPETISVSALEAKHTAAAGQTWVDWMTWAAQSATTALAATKTIFLTSSPQEFPDSSASSSTPASTASHGSTSPSCARPSPP